MKKIFLSLGAALLITGCATTSGLEPQTNVSSFDGTTSVTIQPHAIACSSMVCGLTGFTWNDKKPNNASTMVSIMSPKLGGDYHSIKSVRLNIDGQIINLEPFPQSTTDFSSDDMYKKSSRMYSTPLPLLESIKDSTNTKMQIIADGILIEEEFKNSGDSSKAYYALLRFLEQVDSAKAK